MNYYLDKSTPLCLVIWRSTASMFGCSFVQVPWIYDISSAGETLLGLSGKGHPCPTSFLCCPRDTRRVSMARLWSISRSERKSKLLGIILGFEAAPMPLDSLPHIWPLHSWCESGWLLQWFQPVCSRLGARLNYLLHQVINVLWRNTIYISP